VFRAQARSRAAVRLKREVISRSVKVSQTDLKSSLAHACVYDRPWIGVGLALEAGHHSTEYVASIGEASEADQRANLRKKPMA
jgi:hypothetical protein